MNSQATCWTLIHGAAGGNAKDRETFALLYEPVVRAYLGARWKLSPLGREMDDVVQDVFVECFKQGGALAAAEPRGRDGAFRAFLHGVTRNVAGRFEERRATGKSLQEETAFEARDLPADDESLSLAFDRAWMSALLRQAVSRQEERARAHDEGARRRVALLRLRFADDLPVREIARKWNEPADRLHHEYARAREEFKTALREVLAFHHPDNPRELERELLLLLEHVT
jgi:RNA polymerase sigma-70 factor (ECF subfamily)